ncbi:WXG100 family type VII secretion target [Janibacter terrae]|uniref:WXG100 family type VII secretion target n=1 Tax=Janibacter terrae TaxID=103817 RepID=A0ABZ2FGY4_9MICO|nr:WXG100 family type VII secretion target [Janibacter terrae]MBA4084427.1 hypothetical protein [Kytococcus sp.]HBO55225.1 hypothetical protein [Janibacter terrae]HCE60018.1 hypothetical protein [Janibacter terrae]
MAMDHAMDVERIRDIAAKLKTEAGKVNEIISNGTTQAGTLAENWLGHDSDQFGQDWQDAARQLQNAQQSLEEYSQKANNNADRQDDKSKSVGA